ncbi:MAG: FkbM family methyltransferase [Caldilineaceae bacterium]
MSSISVTPTQPTIYVSANFTAEPLEPALAFWLQQFDLPGQIKFAPYNQLFQQLLDPTSQLASNKNGLNVLLICLEDWLNASRANAENHASPHAASNSSELALTARARIPAGMAQHQLPNGMTIAHQNAYETEYLFTEIFQDQAYLKHGITIKEGDCIVDIGANIGMFTLFAQQFANHGKIYAIEPSPPVFETLQINARLYGDNVTVLNCGVSDANKTATFTYYPHSSVFSGFAADKTADETVLRAIIQNQQQPMQGELSDEYVNTFLHNGRLDSVQYACQLRSLSDIMEAEQIEKIDLLKLDAEKSELAVLQGIRAADWPKIRQIVMEAHENADGTVLMQVTEILAQQGFEVQVDQESLLAGTTFYNIYAWRPTSAASAASTDAKLAEMDTRLQRNIHELARAIQSASQRSAVPLLLCLCPAAPATMAKPGAAALIAQMESALGSQLAELKNVTLITSAEMQRQYATPAYFDVYAYKTGHVPYTSALFAALGSAIMRKYRAMQARPYKVIVLDCDHTLWYGVCAEDGAQGVSMSPAYRQLQAFMIDQAANGMLLCLCSKNQAADVWSVFDQRTDMPLQKEHLVAWRINWRPKSENLRSLAQELQLGLDSFIFIDDNPLECAEVRANCPEVLTLQLPADQEEIGAFLHHVWAFDRLRITQADRDRTRQYQQNAQRERMRQDAPTLQQFLDTLELDVQIAPMTPNQIERIAQLTQRTNQFNLTNVRYTEAEIAHILTSPNHACLTVTVSDRFGDYGLVGAAIFSVTHQAFEVDTFLLSCRALGRHVEHRILGKLAEMAADRGVDKIMLPCAETARNQPAREFVEQVGANFKAQTGQGALYTLPVHVAAAALAQAEAAASSPVGPTVTPAADQPTTSNGAAANSELFQKIAIALNSAAKVAAALELQTRPRPDLPQHYTPPQTEIEHKVARIWQDVLHLDQVGVNDNFIELGGGSLQVVQIHSRLTQALNMTLPITQLFGLPTIRAIIQYLERENGAASTAANAVQDRASKQRMAMNRQKLARNRVR